MRAHISQVKIVALCASLLAVLASALAGCGQCAERFGQPPRAVLTVEHGVVYGVGEVYGANDRFFAMRASDGSLLWRNAENPYMGPNGLDTGVRPTRLPVAPVVDGQAVIETMGVGLFAALRASDGKMQWHSQVLAGLRTDGFALPFPPVVVDGVIYAAVGYGTIAAWSERGGRSLWVARFAPDAEVILPASPTFSAQLPLPVVVGSAVYVSAGRSVYALRISDGSLLWCLPDAKVGTSYSTPVVAAQNVYVADSDGVMFALDPNTGATRWRSFDRGGITTPAVPSVVALGQTVYVASQRSLVRALNAATGAQLWSYETDIGGPLAPLVVEGGRVYVELLGLRLYVLDAATGRELWRAPLDSGIFDSGWAGSPSYDFIQPNLSLPTVNQGIVVVAAAGGVEVWRVADGHQLWAARIPDKGNPQPVESVAVAAGAVYVAQGGLQDVCDFNGISPRVQALRGTDSAKRWRISI